MAKTKKQIKREKLLDKFYEQKMEFDVAKIALDEIKQEVVKVLMDCPDQKTETASAMFSLRRYAKYEYSKKVDKKELEMETIKEIWKGMKKDEEVDGTAELISESFSPVVKE